MLELGLFSLLSRLSSGESLRSTTLELALAELSSRQSLLELLCLPYSIGLELSKVLATGKLSELPPSLHGGKAILRLRLSGLHQELSV